MNKIQKLFLTIVSLLATTNVLATNYHITIVNSNPSSGVLSLEANSDVTSGTHAPGTVTIYAKPTETYYLEEIVIEYVVDLGGAESPRRRVDIGIGQKIVLNKTSAFAQFNSNKANRYGGAYTFTMPSNDVEITATFKSASNFMGNEYITLAISGDDTYNGVARHLVVTNTLPGTPVTLAEGNDFQITSLKIKQGTEEFTYVDAIKDAGTYEIEITGLGTYYNRKTVNTLVINKAHLTITPKNKSRQYRNANPTYGNKSSGTDGDFTYEGLQNGETNSVLTTQPSATIAADINSNVGDYTVTASGAAAANYTISHLTGTLTITPRNVNNTITHATATLSDNTYTFNAEQYYRYDNIAHQPSVTVIDPSDENKVLTNGTDYEVNYSVVEYGSGNWIDVGMYQATITFTNNYTGDAIIRPYQIRKKVTLPYDWNTYYYTDVDMRVPAGMNAYTVTDVGTSLISIREQTYILNGVPMLLYSTSSEFYPELVNHTSATRVGDTPVSGFIGTETPIDMSTSPYADDPTYDYWVLIDGSFVRTKSGILDAHKCYLMLEKTAHAVPSISMVIIADPTGVNTHTRTTIDDGIYYDLSGRRVKSPTRGVYILNGKKIMIK